MSSHLFHLIKVSFVISINFLFELPNIPSNIWIPGGKASHRGETFATEVSPHPTGELAPSIGGDDLWSFQLHSHGQPNYRFLVPRYHQSWNTASQKEREERWRQRHRTKGNATAVENHRSRSSQPHSGKVRAGQVRQQTGQETRK